jgi:glycosyltransferase involved in cell wall biosynthesis
MNTPCEAGVFMTERSEVVGVHVIVPPGVDDSRRPSGGNTYDRRVCGQLRARGWTVRMWPDAGVIADLPDGATVLVDGLVGSAAADVLVPAARRVRLIVLVHMIFGTADERAVLAAAEDLIVTSAWTRDRLIDRYGLPEQRIHVAEPGVDAAELAPPRPDGHRLLCVAAVTAHKGHDVLLNALASIVDRPWRCVCVGSLDREPDVPAGLPPMARVSFAGALVGADLDAAYADADVLVLPSRAETYGMVVTEALARGLPVIASDVGGVPAALGRADDGSRPGLLVPPGDPEMLADALRRWLDDDVLRARLRASARQRREALTGWSVTAKRIARVLAALGAVRT